MLSKGERDSLWEMKACICPRGKLVVFMKIQKNRDSASRAITKFV